jgi:AmmeMemoRadiSam system protein B/AmmeMemoRadiSam system protein A
MADNTKQTIRRPAVAGSFYPGSAADLTRAIATFFSEVDKVPLEGRPIGLVAPHAGYPYSGRVAAKAYKLLEGEEFDTVVIISPSHTVFFKGSSVFGGDGYQTPLGVVEIDQALSDKLASINPSVVYFSNMGHATGSMRGEHALEVQLPFLQIALGKFKLVAIVMGEQETNTISALGETLAAALQGTNTLMVASTDLSHFHSQESARRLDYPIQEAIEHFDAAELVEKLQSGQGEACGGGPVAAMMMAAKRLGGTRVQFLDYATSGDVTGDYSEVVGYLSAAVVAGEKAKIVRSVIGQKAAEPPKDHVLTDEDKNKLLQIARDAIEARLKAQEYVPPTDPGLEEKRGVFVTLRIGGELRGCIGHTLARDPLYKAVADMAVAAAFDDPRFPAVTAVEFDSLEYEISLLSPLERVHDFKSIEIGRDGLMIKLELHSGLLLPQVAANHNWTVQEFLQQACLKAGLPKSAYKDRFAEVYKFSAEVFS